MGIGQLSRKMKMKTMKSEQMKDDKASGKEEKETQQQDSGSNHTLTIYLHRFWVQAEDRYVEVTQGWR